jgi:hypothetical protein
MRIADINEYSTFLASACIEVHDACVVGLSPVTKAFKPSDSYSTHKGTDFEELNVCISVLWEVNKTEQ